MRKLKYKIDFETKPNHLYTFQFGSNHTNIAVQFCIQVFFSFDLVRFDPKSNQPFSGARAWGRERNFMEFGAWM